MGYIYYKSESTSIGVFLTELETKTGIKIEHGDLSSGTYNNCSIQFPGDEKISTSSLKLTYSDNPYVFADVDEKVLFFLGAASLTSALTPGDYAGKLFAEMFVQEKDKVLYFNNITSRPYIYEEFNLPQNYTKNDETIDNITLYPASMQNNYVFKKMFVNFERMFTRGLILKTENGDKYFTLGSYFLYKIN